MDTADLLAELLVQSKEYREYSEAKEALLNKADIAQTLIELRRQQMNLHLAQMIGEDVSNELEEFQNIYFDFTSDPLVSKFLFAEGRFTKLYGEIQKTLGNKIDVLSDLDIKTPDDISQLN